MTNITKVQAPPQNPDRRKRVAAYARVSVDSDAPYRSLSNQVSSYSAMIQSRPDWEYAGVYADNGISGTSIDHRDEFRRLMKDCEGGNIDLILVKSISRFARNTVDLLQTVRHLKAIGVEVYFEEQGISSMTGDGELMLTLLAAVAQEEAQTTSDNIQWSIRKRFEEGIPNGHKRCLGYTWDNDGYVVIPEEAEQVWRIYDMYLSGLSSVQIAKQLEADGVKGISGLPISQSGVRQILSNENYTGDLLLQKSYSPSVHKRAVNHGNVTMYRVEDDHEPIISREMFNAAQALRKERAARLPEKTLTCFSGLMKCGYCGRSVCRRNTSNGAPTWICNWIDRKGVHSCQSGRRLPERELIQATEDILGENYRDRIHAVIQRILVYDDRLEFYFTDEKIRVWRRHFSSNPHERGCFSGKIYCGECGGLYRRKINSKKHYTAWMCKDGCGAPRVQEAELRHAMADVIGRADDVEMAFYLNTDKVTVFEDRFEFHMMNGGMETWRRNNF